MRGAFMLLPFQGADIGRGCACTQGVAPLALGYVPFGLSARCWLMDGCGIFMLFPFQGADIRGVRVSPGCRSACPGLCAFGLSARSWVMGVWFSLVLRWSCVGFALGYVLHSFFARVAYACAVYSRRIRVPNPCVPLSRMSAARGGLKARLPEVKTGAFLCCQGIAIV